MKKRLMNGTRRTDVRLKRKKGWGARENKGCETKRV